MARCSWARTEHSIPYHDREWGRPSHDDRVLFEFIVLEGAQAGLSWETILKKRERYREVFHGFDVARAARLTEARLERILLDPGVVRHRMKIWSVRDNARAALDVQREFGSLDAFVWQFVSVRAMREGRAFRPAPGGERGRPIVNRPRTLKDIPAQSAQAEALSRELKRRGFRFVGPTICYAFMQAVGLVNDHLADCPCLRGSKRGPVAAIGGERLRKKA